MDAQITDRMMYEDQHKNKELQWHITRKVPSFNFHKMKSFETRFLVAIMTKYRILTYSRQKRNKIVCESGQLNVERLYST